MEMKTLMKYYCQTVRMASIKKKRQQMPQRIRRKGKPSTLLVALQSGTATGEKSREGPQRLKTQPPYDPAFGYVSKESQGSKSKRYMDSHIHSSIIYNKQNMETV